MYEFLNHIAEQPAWQTCLVLTAIVAIRYVLLSGLTYLYFYRWAAAKLQWRKIDPASPQRRIVRREFLWSLLTCLIFGVSGALVLQAWAQGHTLLYAEIDAYGWWYLPVSFVLAVLVHETYFYWTHRIMHHPRLFRPVHLVHHESYNPTPFASFSFHPWEALVEAAALPLVAWTVPMHPSVLMLWLVFMSVLGVTNHLGYEFYPQKTPQHWFGKWWIGPTHHFQHHRKVNCNYGLYFTFWDRWCGTERSDYGKQFASIYARSGSSRSPSTQYPPHHSESLAAMPDQT